jgi:hypothetical protein
MQYGFPPSGAAIIGSMFVYKIKMNPDGSIEKYKVRLVALGNHQKYGETFSETYAPGTQLSSSRLILILALKMHEPRGEAHEFVVLVAVPCAQTYDVERGVGIDGVEERSGLLVVELGGVNW